MANELFQTGEEFHIRRTYRTDTVNLNASVLFTLYNQSTDNLSDTSLISDLTSEPTGSAFARQSLDLDTSSITVSLSSGNFQAQFDDVVFDTSDSSASVDAYMTIVQFESTVAGDSSVSENLFFAGNLDQTYDLGQIDQFTLQETGIAID